MVFVWHVNVANSWNMIHHKNSGPYLSVKSCTEESQAYNDSNALYIIQPSNQAEGDTEKVSMKKSRLYILSSRPSWIANPSTNRHNYLWWRLSQQKEEDDQSQSLWHFGWRGWFSWWGTQQLCSLLQDQLSGGHCFPAGGFGGLDRPPRGRQQSFSSNLYHHGSFNIQ